MSTSFHISQSELLMPLSDPVEKKLINRLAKDGLLTEVVTKALQQAKKSHLHQKRDEGTPYFENHIVPVTNNLLDYYELNNQTPPIKTITAAILHDTLEDDKSIDHSVFKKTFGKDVYDMVMTLTKPDIKDGWKKTLTAYMSNLYKSTKETKLIKCADMLANIKSLSLSPNKEKQISVLKKFEEFYLPFAKQTDAWFYDQIKSEFERVKRSIE